MRIILVGAIKFRLASTKPAGKYMRGPAKGFPQEKSRSYERLLGKRSIMKKFMLNLI